MSQSSSISNKRIAKNTFFLYIRLGVIMLVKLYTSRVLLDVLGIDDYGIWNVVAAFVISFSFISSPLVTATQRFLNFDMGKGGKELNKIFSISLELFIVIGLIIFMIFETFGLWFLDNKLVFPEGSRQIVYWVFQFCILTTFVNTIRLAYEAAIVANERMSFYAFYCIIEAILLLGIAFIIQIDLPYNKLICYSCMTLIISIGMMLSYIYYCNRNIKYISFKPQWDKKLVKELSAFSGWNLLGGVSSMTANQGINILINIFFGVVLNAAYGISMQVCGAVSVILDNLLKAANPQIVKSYASGDLLRMESLLANIMKASFMLCFAFIVPMIINIDLILKIWLGDIIPPYTQQFAVLTLIQLLLVCMGNPIDIAIFATGKIKSYQIWLSCVIFLNIILSYILFKFGQHAIWALIVKCLVEVIILTIRMLYLKIRLNFDMKEFFKRTLFPLILISAITIVATYLLNILVPFGESWHRLFISSLFFFPLVILSSWFLLLNQAQRKLIQSYIVLKFHSNED